MEAHYYALLPLYAAAVARAGRGRPSRARFSIAAAGLGVLAVVGMICCFEFTRRGLPYWASLPAHLLWFAAGMALALASAWLEGREGESRVVRLVVGHPSACWALAAALYAALCLTPGVPRAFSGEAYTATERLFEQCVYAAVALLVMLPAVFGTGAGGLPRRALGSRSLSAIGIVSYGVFLWHLPLLREMQERGLARLIPDWPFLSLALLILPAALACGALSYVAVERPAIRAGRR